MHRKLNIFIFLLLFCKIPAFSQKKIEASKTTIHNTDTLVFYKASMEPVNGIVYDLFEDGKTKYQITYLNGKKHGVFKKWYANEQLESEVNYVYGKWNGYSKRWYENGQLENKVLWKNDDLIEGYAWYEDGQTKWICPPVDKFGNKKTTSYFQNGLLQEEHHFKNGYEHGTQKYWHDNGQLETEVNFEYSKLHGIFKRWTKEGFLYLEYSFSQGKKNGIIKEWQLDGKYIDELWKMDHLECQKVYQDNVLIAEFNFIDGKLNGTQTIYDSKGKNLILQENYKEGNYEGCQKKWFENGQLEREENFIDGKKTGWQRYYDISGKLLGESNLIDGTGKISVKYANGQRAFEENYLNGELDGLQKSWYKSGQIAAEYNFVSGKRVGLQAAYSEKGEIVEEGNLIDGNGIIKASHDYYSQKVLYEYQNGLLVEGGTYDGDHILYENGKIVEIKYEFDGSFYTIKLNGNYITIIEREDLEDEDINCSKRELSMMLLNKSKYNDQSLREISSTITKYLEGCFIIKEACFDSCFVLKDCMY